MEPDLNVKHLHHYTCALSNISQTKKNRTGLYWGEPLAHFNA